MAELFTLNFGKGYWTLAGNSTTAAAGISCWHRVTLQANTWRKRGITNAQVAVTTRTHYCLTMLQHLQELRAPLASLNLTNVNFCIKFYCFLKCFYFSVCVVFNEAELFHYSALCPTDKLEFYWTLFLHCCLNVRYLQLRYRHDYVYH